MPTITFDKDERLVRIDADIRLADRLHRIPGLRARKEDGTGRDYWVAYPGWATLLAIGAELADIPGFTADPSLDPIIDWWMSVEARAAHIRNGGTYPEPLDPRLYPYQPAGVWWLTEMERAILADEMGTGKTPMSLQGLERLDAYPALVVCPTSMMFEWAREAETWAPNANPYVIAGTPGQKKKKLAAAAEDDHALVIVSWGSLRNGSLTKLKWHGGAKALTAEQKSDGPLQDIDFLTVIADEVHRAKDPSSQQTMGLKGATGNARWRWGLTGTPISNHPGDCWSLFNWLDPEEWTSSHDFLDRFVLQIESKYGMKPIAWQKDTRDEIDRHLARYTLRRTKAEVMPHLPAKTYQVRELEMTGKQKTAYNKLRTEGLALIDDEVLVATDPMSLRIRLSQAASATPVINDGEVTELDTPSNKIAALHEILNEMSPEEQLVVFAESRKLLERVAIDFGKDKTHQTFVEITGEVDPEQRSNNIALFQAGNARVALVTLGAGAEGITLTAADTAVFLQRSYSMVQNKQAEDRIHRAGQESDKVLIIDLVSRGTIDEEVMKAASWKEHLLEDTLKDVGMLKAALEVKP